MLQVSISIEQAIYYIDVLQTIGVTSYMQNIVIGVIALSIPFVILFVDKTEGGLEMRIGVETVLRWKIVFFIVVFLLSSPIIIDNFQQSFLTLLVIFLWVLLLVALLFRIAVTIKWFVYPDWRKYYREKHLRKSHKTLDALSAWEEVWNNQYENFVTESEVFTIYKDVTNKLIDRGDFESVQKLLKIFSDATHVRNSIFLTSSDELLESLFDWRAVLTKEKQHLTTDFIDRVLENISETATRDGIGIYTYFSNLEKITTEKKKGVIDLLLPLWLDNIPKLSRARDIWQDAIPAEWKITRQNYQQNKLFVENIRDTYLRWLHNKLKQNNSSMFSYNNELELNTSELFPDTEPRIWSMIILLELNEYEMDMSWIIQPRPFGLRSRTFTYTGYDDDKIREEMSNHIKAQETESVELAKFIFPRFSNKNFLEMKIKALQELYTKDIDDTSKRKIQAYIELLERFRKGREN